VANFINSLLNNALLVSVALAVIGVVLSLLGIGTPGALAFMLVGMLIMFVSGRREAPPG
jgi:hypothetical protein